MGSSEERAYIAHISNILSIIADILLFSFGVYFLIEKNKKCKRHLSFKEWVDVYFNQFIYVFLVFEFIGFLGKVIDFIYLFSNLGELVNNITDLSGGLFNGL